ncbi:MAG: DUF1513 domain-containing protein [Pseudomonadota bacterium]
METRRDILKRLALGLGVAACGAGRLFGQPGDRAGYAAIETSSRTGLSQARFFSASGTSIGTAPLDFRAHGLSQSGRRLVVFPRRPGNRFAVMDAVTLEILVQVTAPPHRHFYGHGAFSVDGQHLIVTENDLDTLDGGLGIYDALNGFRRLGQIALPGSGPHEIMRDRDRNTFYIALGGLQTHPDYGRTALNLDDFRSQIVVLDHDRGTLAPMGYWSGSEGVSLRHLSVDGAGSLYIGGQLANASRGDGNAVLWRCEDGAAVALNEGSLLGSYVSSLASFGERTVVTSKASNTVIELSGGTLASHTSLTGASAAAVSADGSIASGYSVLRLNGSDIAVTDRFEFDNHGLHLRATT